MCEHLGLFVGGPCDARIETLMHCHERVTVEGSDDTIHAYRLDDMSSTSDGLLRRYVYTGTASE
jgi:hypothetical protein